MVSLIEQVSLFLVFSVAGYILSKTKFIDPTHVGLLSKITVFLFLPATILKSMAQYCSIKTIKEYYPLILVSLVILLILLFGSMLFFKFTKMRPFDKKVYIYSLVVPNFGYMGYALAESIFGSEMQFLVILFCLPLSIYTYTFGYCMLMSDDDGFKFDFKRFINPVFIGTVIGCVLGLCNIPLPNFFVSLLTKASNCTGPISMILVGSVIAEFKFKDLLNDWKSYILVAFRTLIIPISVCFILKAFNAPVMSFIVPAVLILAMPCGSNTVVFAKMKGESSEAAASPVIISTVLCLITIPLCLSLSGTSM